MRNKGYIVATILPILLGLMLGFGIYALDVGAFNEDVDSNVQELSGWNDSARLGNTVASGASVDMAGRANGKGMTTASCVGWVTTAAGATSADVANLVVEGSMDDTNWFDKGGMTLVASTVADFTNTGGPYFRYLRSTITNMSTVDTTNVNVRCYGF